MLSASLKKNYKGLLLLLMGGAGGGGKKWNGQFYFTLDSHTSIVISHTFAYSSRSKTVTRSIGLKGCGVYFSAKFSWTSPLTDQVRSLISPRSKGKETVSKNELHGQSFC